MSFYGKVWYEGEGVLAEKEFDTKAEALAFALGFKAAQEITKEEDLDPLEEYGAGWDTEPAKDDP